MDLSETEQGTKEPIVLDDSDDTDSRLDITSKKGAAECTAMEIDTVDSNINFDTDRNEMDHSTKEVDQVDSTSNSHVNLMTDLGNQADDIAKEIDQTNPISISDSSSYTKKVTKEIDPVLANVSDSSLMTNVDQTADSIILNTDNADNDVHDGITETQTQLPSTEERPDTSTLQIDRELNQTLQEGSGATFIAAGACKDLCIMPTTEPLKDTEDLATPVRNATEAVETETNQNSLATTQGSHLVKYILSDCTEDAINICKHCCLARKSKFKITHGTITVFLCDDKCLAGYKDTMGDQISNLEDAKQSSCTSTQAPFQRKCKQCNSQISDSSEFNLFWETLEFCNDNCLEQYQKLIGSNCLKCQASVQENCIGKYCVRFGCNICQFCSSACLAQYKKALRVCSYCKMEKGKEGFLPPVMGMSLLKDFCSEECVDKYKALENASATPSIEGSCSVCLNDKTTIMFQYCEKQNQFCGEPCLLAFKFVNNISADKCDMCNKFFDDALLAKYTVYYNDTQRKFCSMGCQNMYILNNKKILACDLCKVKKFSFDMIKHNTGSGSAVLACSLNCLRQVMSSNKTSKWICNECYKHKHPLYNLAMTNGSVRNFCSYACVLEFQTKYSKIKPLQDEPIPVGSPKRFVPSTTRNENSVPISASIEALKNLTGPFSQYNNTHMKELDDASSKTVVKTQIRQQVIIKPQFPVVQRNVSTMCKVTMTSKGTGCRKVIYANKEIQTEEIKDKIATVPIPVPIYVPVALLMYSLPFPVPFPFALPIPIPIFIPTTRNSTKGIMKEMKKIQAKIPSNPLEAELLMMADMVAGDNKDDATDSETEGEEPIDTVEEHVYTPEPVDGNSSFGEEVLEMAIKMAAELDEPAVDLEGALAVNTVTVLSKTEPPESQDDNEERTHIVERKPTRGRGGGRGSRGRRPSRRSLIQPDISMLEHSEPPQESLVKPDANMCLKYTFGVNAWKQWVATKNSELEQTSKRVKLFKPEVLQLTADELNYSLCLFVKEVRKPNGQEYAPDTIYYLCLGIQQYLYENGRIDNIFCDAYYDRFTDCLDEVAKKFSVLYNDSNYIITRVEEEHLWESKQLGAHSPHVLLSTLMFFNTKHFNLTTVDDHLKLSFSHIMKHWKRNPTHSGSQKSTGSRNVLLRFYPPQSAEGNVTRKKKVYEQQENEENPLRCPVKLYEFYLSKCPESVKTRNDVFYLLPERSCVPDSPVWYSTLALPKKGIEKMLHRVKMVKEINVALLTN